jgi:hypothetical protein
MSTAATQPAVPVRERRWYRYGLGLAPVIVLVVVPCCWLAVAIYRTREAALDCNCQGPLNQLHVAFMNYESVHGHFPPAYIADKDGSPIHSWRVLILPLKFCKLGLSTTAIDTFVSMLSPTW